MPTLPPTPPVLPDFPTQRANARRHLERGTLTDSYRAQPYAVIALLNEALATEIVCALRYKRHYFTARGLASAALPANSSRTRTKRRHTANVLPSGLHNLAVRLIFAPTR